MQPFSLLLEYLMASPAASLPLKIAHVLNNLGCTSAIKASFIAFGLHKLS